MQSHYKIKIIIILIKMNYLHAIVLRIILYIIQVFASMILDSENNFFISSQFRSKGSAVYYFL